MNPALVASALLLGLLGSAHCMAMCGGVAGLFCAAGGGAPGIRLRWYLAYHAGRIASYTLAGCLVGGLASATVAVVPTVSVQLALRWVAGASMVAVGLSTAGIFRLPARLRGSNGIIATALRRVAAPWLPVRTFGHALGLGLIWGWMPCGLLYSALGLALASGSASTGAATMLAFGLATSPALLALGAAARWAVGPLRSPHVRAVAGLLIALSGAMNLVVAGEQSGWLRVGSDPASAHVHCSTR